MNGRKNSSAPLSYALATGSQRLESHDLSDDFVLLLDVGAFEASTTGAGRVATEAAADAGAAGASADTIETPGAMGGWPSSAGSTRSGASDDVELGAADVAAIAGAAGLATTAGFCGTGLTGCIGALAEGAATGSLDACRSGVEVPWTSRRVLSGTGVAGRTTAGDVGAGVGAGGGAGGAT